MKIRKLPALFLALALLAAPALSLGENAPSSVFEKVVASGRSVKTTVTFEPGELLPQDASLAPPIPELLKALRLEVITQQKEGVYLLQSEVFLQDKSSLTFTEVVEPSQFHFQSNLFGDKMISFTLEEYFQFLITQLEAEETDEALIAFYKAYFQMYASLLKGETPKLPEFDAQSLQQDLMAPLNEWFVKLASAPEVTTGTFESDRHDTATLQMVYSLSAVQMADFLDIIFGWAAKDVNLDAILSYISTISPDFGDLSSSKEDVQAVLREMPGEFLAEAAPALPEPFTVTTWMTGEGALAALEFKASIFGEDKEKAQDTILAGYYAKTEEDGVNTELTFDAASGADSFALSFSGKDISAGGTQWQAAVDVKQYGMDAFGMKLDFSNRTETAGTGVKDSWRLNAQVSEFSQVTGILLDNTSSTTPAGADVRKEGKLDVYLTGQSAPLVSILYESATGEPVEIPAIPKDSTRLGKMSAEEFQAWAEELSATIMVQLSQIIQNLPPSVLSFLNESAAY